METKGKLIVMAWLVMIVITASGQNVESNANYWVVEGNVKTNDFTIIRFYDSGNQLIHEETMEGKFLDITKKKNVRFLNKKLRDFDSNGLTVKKSGRKSRKRGLKV
jgi:hypothetical protein